MEKQRLFALDLTRCFALFVVVSYHFGNAAELSGASQDSFLLSYTLWGFDIGDAAVSLFFILSGAALMLSGAGELSVLPFYKRRFLSLYPLFWLSWLAALAVRAVRCGGEVFEADTPAVSILLTVFGLDGMLAFLPTFYLLGEWFLGVIALLYLIFPLLRLFFLRKPAACWICCTALYAACLCLSRDLTFDKVRIILPLHIPELLFGMTWTRYFRRSDPVSGLASLFALGTAGLVREVVPRILTGSLTGAALFIALCNLAALLLKPGRAGMLMPLTAAVSKYSYAVYLMHHFLIEEILQGLSLEGAGKGTLLLVYIPVMVLVGAASYAIFRLHRALSGLLRPRAALRSARAKS